MLQVQLKQQVAKTAIELAAAWLRPGDILGIGTGSTVSYFIKELGERKLPIRGVFSSSEASSEALHELGVDILDTNCGERASLYIDSADEIDSNGALIKGGGGALTREKVVASLSQDFLCLVDESKVVECLGRFPLPVEAIPMAKSHVASRIEQLGGKPQERFDFRTDNGNVILDVENLTIDDPQTLERTLNNITGVVENGVFWKNRPSLTLVSCENGVGVCGTAECFHEHDEKLKAAAVCCYRTLG